MDQRRADALVSLAAQQWDDPGLPRWQGRRPSVQVTVWAATLLHLADGPGKLKGYGPIPAARARAVAAAVAPSAGTVGRHHYQGVMPCSS